MSKAKELVLVGVAYINNGWYGDRHRVILAPAEGEGFKTKTEARKHAAKLKNYINSQVRKADYKLTTKDIQAVERDTLREYTYVSMGPALSYTHHDITVDFLTS